MKDLTVVIPTIGRDSLAETINSIESDCQLIISLDRSADENKIKLICNNIKDRVTIVKSDKMGLAQFFNMNLGPGYVKQAGIYAVKTKYFMILDDDDLVNKGYLEFAMNKIKSTEADWMASHYSQDITEIMNDSIEVINPAEFLARYFDFDRYDKKLDSVYPGSEIICNTESFKSHQEATNHYFNLNYLDDIVPMVSFMKSHKGILHKGYGFTYKVFKDSVSHTKFDPFEKSGMTEVVNIVAKLAILDGDPVWFKAMQNLLKTTRYNYTHF